MDRPSDLNAASAGEFAASPTFVNESAREIPIVHDVDIVIVGGSSGGVAAAVEAASAGAKVFVAAPRPYLGEDICGTMRFWLEPGEHPVHELASKIFGTGSYRPMHVKRVLDAALLDVGVEFLFGCLVTDVLADANGAPAGIVMANRAGRQAVLAKVVIDATDRAWVARMAGVEFRPYPPGPHEFKRVVVGGEPKRGQAIAARVTEMRLVASGADTEGLFKRYYYTKHGSAKTTYDAIDCTLTLSMEDGSYCSFAEAEQRARDMTFDPRQVDSSEFLFQAPPDAMRGRASVLGAWPGAEAIDLNVFRPIDLKRMYVLSGCADVSPEAAETLTRPLAMIEVGARVGAGAANEARGESRPGPVRLLNAGAPSTSIGDVREVLVGVRPVQRRLPTLQTESRGLPVLGAYDVVVVGGGSSGAPAAIGAARQGAKTLVVEYQHALGGMGTTGLIGNYFHGYKGGFTNEVIEGVRSLGAIRGEARMEWWRREIRDADGEIWLGCLGCGALVEGQRVRGVVVATPAGRGLVLAKVVVDATGNADIAVAAGAECVEPWSEDIVVQGAGLAPRDLGMSRNSTDWTFADDADMVDHWHHSVHAKERFPNAYDLATLTGTRERRRIEGQFELSPLDIVNQRTYVDTVSIAQCFFDSHGFLIHPLFEIEPAVQTCEFTAHIPYRCLLPKRLQGILVIGLGMSAHHDAMALVRMQADMQNRGYAAGVAAALAASQGGQVRDVDMKKLQRHLVAIEALPESVLTDQDSYPIAATEIAAAVKAFVSGAQSEGIGHPLAKILTEPEVAIDLLQSAYGQAAEHDQKVRCAQILAYLGNRTGVPTLIAELQSAGSLDEGYHYNSWGWTRLSRLDSLIVALGRSGDRRAVGPILVKLESLDERGDFSHVRAVATALEALRVPAAAPSLAALLAKKVQGSPMAGHAIKTLDDSRQWSRQPARYSRSRYLSLRELIVARALFRCGDHEGLGLNTLMEYTNDLRGPLARHAQAVVENHVEWEAKSRMPARD